MQGAVEVGRRAVAIWWGCRMRDGAGGWIGWIGRGADGFSWSEKMLMVGRCWTLIAGRGERWDCSRSWPDLWWAMEDVDGYGMRRTGRRRIFGSPSLFIEGDEDRRGRRIVRRRSWVAGLGKMTMEHHTGAPCSGGAL
ncbi:hypothetical protein ACLOJK_029173 [Asimina triloba]